MKESKRPKLRLFLIAFFVVIATLIIALVAAFSVFRWAILDDAASLQGVWSIEGSDVRVVITDTEICTSDDMIFTYEIDTQAKSITEHLAEKTGKVHYVFSANRKEVVFIEQDLDFFSATFLDAGNLLQTFFAGEFSESSAGFTHSDIAEDSIVRLQKV